MKRIKQMGLLGLYVLLLVSSMKLHFAVLQNPDDIWWYNLLTVGIFVVVGGLSVLLYQSLEKQKVDENPEPEGEVQGSRLQGNLLPENQSLRIDWETYQKKIGGCNLTKREAEIGYLIISDYTNAMIAAELFIAETTVKKHVSHIFEKTGTNSRKEWKEFVKKG